MLSRETTKKWKIPIYYILAVLNFNIILLLSMLLFLQNAVFEILFKTSKD